jgi:hypothetical protein
MNARDVERAVTVVLHQHAEDAMKRTNTAEQLEAFQAQVSGHGSNRRRWALGAIGAASVAAVAAVAFWVVNPGDRADSGRPEEPAGSNTATPITELFDGEHVPPGRYAVPFEGLDEEVAWAEVDVATGFEVQTDSVLWPDDDRPPRALMFWTVDGVNAQPCRGPDPPRFADPGPTVEDLAMALHQQPHRLGAAPTPVTFAGYEGLYLELRLPKRLKTDSCTTGSYEAWQALDPTTMGRQERYQYGPGFVDRIWILDADGQRLVVNATFDPRITDSDAAALDAMLESITIHTDEPGRT